MVEEAIRERKIVSAESVPPEPASMPDDVRQVFEYWESLKVGENGPHPSKFYLDELPPRLIPASMLYDVIDGGRDCRYRFFGSDRVKSHGENYTNRYVSEISPPLMANKIIAELQNVIDSKAATVVHTVAALSGEEFEYSMLRLPLFDEAGNVVRIYALPYNSTGPELPERQWGHWFGRHEKEQNF